MSKMLMYVWHSVEPDQIPHYAASDLGLQCLQKPICPNTIGIKHGFSCINICQVPWEVLKTKAEGCGFQHLPRDLANVNALKKHVRSLLLHKN